jgi:transcriptional regulator with XRE-family HTH domain
VHVVGTQGPAGPRRRLGAELRRLRTSAGMHLDQVAEQLGVSTSKISRLETGKGLPKVADVRGLIRIYDVRSENEQEMLLRLVRDSRTPGWWESYTDGVHPERFVLDSPGRYEALETEATEVRSFDPTALTGLLQTEDYARAVLAAQLPHSSPQEIDQLVELRLRRQDALRRTDRAPLALTAVLDEAVLRRVVGGGEVMAAQMRCLLEWTERDNVTVRVLPFAAGLHRAHAGLFVILRIPEALGSDVVYIEGHAGETCLENESDVDLYKEVLADVLARALSPAATRDIVGRYLDDHVPRPEGRP